MPAGTSRKKTRLDRGRLIPSLHAFSQVSISLTFQCHFLESSYMARPRPTEGPTERNECVCGFVAFLLFWGGLGGNRSPFDHPKYFPPHSDPPF